MAIKNSIFIVFAFLLFVLSCQERTEKNRLILGLRIGDPPKVVFQKLNRNLCYDTTYNTYDFGFTEGNINMPLIGKVNPKFAIDEKGDTILFVLHVYYSEEAYLKSDSEKGSPDQLVGIVERQKGDDANFDENFQISNSSREYLIRKFTNEYGICEKVFNCGELGTNVKSRMWCTSNENRNFFYRWIIEDLEITLSFRYCGRKNNKELYNASCDYMFKDAIATKLFERMLKEKAIDEKIVNK